MCQPDPDLATAGSRCLPGFSINTTITNTSSLRFHVHLILVLSVRDVDSTFYKKNLPTYLTKFL